MLPNYLIMVTELVLGYPLIDGKKELATSGETTELIDPSTGQVWAKVLAGGNEELKSAVEAADRAFSGGDWPKIKGRDRGYLLFKLANLIRDNAESLAQLESRNVGKPISQARSEVLLAADCFNYYAGTVDKIGGQTIPTAANGLLMTIREPIGVCGLIVPWNFPLLIAAWKIAPALAMGNTIIVKPASQTPLTALRLGELALEAGVPPGVLNIVTGSGQKIGNALVSHPKVRKISFTGSNTIGIEVMKLAAEGVKPVTLELGGKSANIVFADAEPEKALDSALWSVLGNTGQDCCARSRLLLERPLYESFVAQLVERFRSLRLGLPLDESTEIGPLISFTHREKVHSWIERGLKEGAILVQGGDFPTQSELLQGAYLNPALFINVAPNSSLAQEEIFGPVLCVIPFEKESEAIAIANNSLYGLSGSIWTRDIERALRVAHRINTGVLSINSGNSVHLEAPFGGVKYSGFGRELGLNALENYSQIKSIFISF